MQSQNSLLHFQHTYFLHIVIYIYIYIYYIYIYISGNLSVMEVQLPTMSCV